TRSKRDWSSDVCSSDLFLSLILLHWRRIMFKSFKINLFLLHFKLVFILFKLFPLQKKTTFVTDYGVNVTYVASQVDLQTNEDIIILTRDDWFQVLAAVRLL